MIPDRRRRRLRGLVNRVMWPLRLGWTARDQHAYEWEIVWMRRERS